jgi:plastocyanin
VCGTTTNRWSTRRQAFLALLLMAAVSASAIGAETGRAAKTAAPARHQVVIEAVAYAPAVLSVHRGDTVVWVNRDPFPHTVTAAGTFDSGAIAAGASWKYVATKAGAFDYLCTLHPNMKGTLKVEP